MPSAAAEYCRRLWEQHSFLFRVTRPRRTRFGTHQFHPTLGHQVTVNADLHPEAFLITYLHEVAHVLTVRQAHQNRRRVPPHGTQWQDHFRSLLSPVLIETIFPLSVLQPLRLYAQRPTAATASCPALMSALQGLDEGKSELIHVQHLHEGALFELGPKRFVRGPLRRSRVLCTEQKTGRQYTVAALAKVKPV